MGGIDLDPASSPEANEVVRASRFYTREDYGLIQDWTANSIFVNPPFGDAVGEFVEKLLATYESGAVSQAILLVAARTDTQWFKLLYDYPLCFVEGRGVYWNPGRPSGESFASVFAYLGPNLGSFVLEFSQYGTVYLGIPRRAVDPLYGAFRRAVAA